MDSTRHAQFIASAIVANREQYRVGARSAADWSAEHRRLWLLAARKRIEPHVRRLIPSLAAPVARRVGR